MQNRTFFEDLFWKELGFAAVRTGFQNYSEQVAVGSGLGSPKVIQIN
jgi:hypothetical protein